VLSPIEARVFPVQIFPAYL